MKTKIALCLSALFCVCAFGNVYGLGSFHELKRTNIQIHVGPSFPIGSFGKSAFTDINFKEKSLEYNGAGMGINYGISFDFYVINEYFGVYIAFNGHNNMVKEENVPVPFTGVELNTTLGRKDWTTKDTDKWNEFMAMAGFTFRYPMLDFLMITARVGIGYAHLLSPFYRATVQEGRALYTSDLSSGSEPAFGFSAGIGVGFLLTRGFHLNIKGDYMGTTNIEYKTTNSIYTSNVNDPSATASLQKGDYTFNQSFNAINVSLGFTIAF